MKIFLNILKEIGIGILIIVILLAVTVLAFRKQLPYDEQIREGEEYTKVNMQQYSAAASSDRTEGVTATTIVHEADSNQIIEAESEVRIQTGKDTPFGSISTTSNLPTEKVGVTVSPDGTSNAGDTGSNTNNTTNDKLEYPATEDLVEQVEKEQSESAESAANRRFNNEEQ